MRRQEVKICKFFLSILSLFLPFHKVPNFVFISSHFSSLIWSLISTERFPADCIFYYIRFLLKIRIMTVVMTYMTLDFGRFPMVRKMKYQFYTVSIFSWWIWRELWSRRIFHLRVLICLLQFQDIFWFFALFFW